MNSSFALRSVFALCLGAAALTFASCSDDDETTGGNPPTPGQTDPDSPAAAATPVTGLASQWGEAAVYRYDAEGRLVSGTDLEGNAFRFTFSPMGLSLDDGDGYTEKWSGIRLNADGTLASGSAAFEDSYEGDTDRGSGNIAKLTSLYSGELSFTYAAAPDTASKVAPLSAPKPAKRRAHLFGRMAR